MIIFIRTSCTDGNSRTADDDNSLESREKALLEIDGHSDLKVGLAGCEIRAGYGQDLTAGEVVGTRRGRESLMEWRASCGGGEVDGKMEREQDGMQDLYTLPSCHHISQLQKSPLV